MNKEDTRVTDKEEKAFGKKTKEIYDRAEARFTDELPAAIEEAKKKAGKK